jgi:hypothetical protein
MSQDHTASKCQAFQDNMKAGERMKFQGKKKIFPETQKQLGIPRE